MYPYDTTPHQDCSVSQRRSAIEVEPKPGRCLWCEALGLASESTPTEKSDESDAASEAASEESEEEPEKVEADGAPPSLVSASEVGARHSFISESCKHCSPRYPTCCKP